MGFRIWRKDGQEWSLAFDNIFASRDAVDDRIAELNAAFNDMVKFGELTFYAYPEGIKLSKKGEVIDNKLPIRRKKKFRKRKFKKATYL